MTTTAASKSEVAYKWLRSRITGHMFSPGYRLVLGSIAEDLKMSVVPVREAIRQLAGRGVLASRQGAGVFVTALDAPEDWDAVLRKAGIAAVIEARIAIETEAAALAAVRRTPADLRSIRRALADRGAQRSDIESHVDADTAFHRTIVAASHNPVLLDLFDSFTPRLRESMIEMLRLRREFGDDADHDAHAEQVEAIADRDESAASARSRAHLLALRDALA